MYLSIRTRMEHMMSQTALTPKDWIEAGIRALVAAGPAALKVEPLARQLKTTKGSFYWHFKDLQAFKLAILQHWQSQSTQAVIEQLDAMEPGLQRLSALISMAGQANTKVETQPIDMAIREWARHDSQALDCLQQVDKQRLAYLKGEFAYIYGDDDRLARLLYAAHLGLKLLAHSDGHNGEAELQLLMELVQHNAIQSTRAQH